MEIDKFIQDQQKAVGLAKDLLVIDKPNVKIEALNAALYHGAYVVSTEEFPTIETIIKRARLLEAYLLETK